jgi:hypothetical protein
MDLGQGGWPVFPDCEAGDIAETIWSVSSAGHGGFCQEWDVEAASRYVLVHPADQHLFTTRPPDETVSHENWKIDTWTSAGPLKISTFSSWIELARVIRRYLLRPVSHATRAQAQALGSARAIVQWFEEYGSDWEIVWAEAEPVWRALDRKIVSDTSSAVLLCSLMRVLKIRTDLCFPVLDTSLPGSWFGKPAVRIFDKEPIWWNLARRPRPHLSLNRGLIEMP